MQLKQRLSRLEARQQPEKLSINVVIVDDETRAEDQRQAVICRVSSSSETEGAK